MRGALREQPRLPWRGSTPNAARCSYEGAKDAQTRAQAQLWAYLAFLKDRGALGATDREAAEALQLERTSICARRGWLVARGFVGDSGQTRPGPTGTRNVVWCAR